MSRWTEAWDEDSIINVLSTGDLNRRDEAGATALWHAAYFGNVQRLAELLDAGADPNGHDAARIKAASGDSHVVEIWQDIPKDANLAPRGSSTLLHVAAAGVGDSSVAELLLDRGFDIHGRDCFGSTPLNIACFAKNAAFAAKLLERGANPNLHDAAGFAALDHAISDPSLVRTLLDAGASPDGGPKTPWSGTSYEWTAVTSAAYGNADTLRILLSAGAHVSKHPMALPLAAKHGNRKSVRLLLKAGADVDATVDWDHRALEAAAQYASVGCVELLLPRCAHQLDRALAVAVRHAASDTDTAPNDRGADRQTVVAMLLKAKANPNEALHAAAQTAHLPYVNLLLGAGADPSHTDENGRTPLHAAAATGNRDIVRALLAAGAEPTAKDKEGKTPWDEAHRAYHECHLHDARLVMHELRDAGGAPVVDAPEPEPTKPRGIADGCRIEHVKFGAGLVKRVDGQGDQAKVTVVFDSVGEKTLLARFLTLLDDGSGSRQG